ncbi:MAG: response regulator [Alphaproteobacteria bacterium]|nr:response regulator [Alphaproteobacteria bacterium]
MTCEQRHVRQTPMKRYGSLGISVLTAAVLSLTLYLAGVGYSLVLFVFLTVLASGAGTQALLSRRQEKSGPATPENAELPHPPAIEQTFERLFEQAPVAAAHIDQTRRILACNRALREMLNVDKPEGSLFEDHISKENRPALIEHLTASASGTKAEAPIEVSLEDDSDRIVSIYDARMGDDMSVMVSLVDTTRQRTLEHQVAQSQKMQAVGQLAGGIAHDFNNLLTAMIGFCDLLLQRHRAGDQSFADIMQIKQNANRAARLVRQLLAFSRQQTLEPRLLNVTDVLAELSNLLQRLLGERVEMRMIHGRDLGLVKADQGQLDQVVINLAVNARDAMAKGGVLTVSTDKLIVDTPIQAHGEEIAPGEYVTISVRDSGAGISAGNLERIFDPFFTTKEVGAGTGLGLSTVYGIVKQTDGYILVKSGGEIQGSEFTIYLKRYENDIDSVSLPDQDDEDARRDVTGGGTVFLVEDEDPVRLFSARALRSKGYKVIEARNGEAALEILTSEDFDLLITDMVMPKVDGAAVVRAARAERADVPVICISGYAEESVLEEVEAINNVYFLPKPFSLKQLAGKVKEALEGRVI